MPRRDDIQKILLIGSGPIVIGQAAEFDYSGVQACKVLLEEGFEVVLVNSNPATIMTDPEFATATYIEPLLPGPGDEDHRKGAPRRAAADARRPDGAEPGDEPARGRHPGAARGRADRRQRRGDQPRRGPREVPHDDDRGGAADPLVDHRRDARRGRGGARRGPYLAAGDHPPGLHDGRPGRRHRPHRDRAAPGRLRGPRRQPDQPGPGRGVGDRLGRVRARGDARPQRQRRDHLLDRERRPDGRPHRRLGHRGAGPDPDRSRSTRTCATRRSR